MIFVHPEMSVLDLTVVCERHELAPIATPAGNIKLERAKEYLRQRGITKPRVRIGDSAPWDPFAPRTMK